MFASDNGASSLNVNYGSGDIGSVSRWAALQRSWANVSNTPLRGFKNQQWERGIRTPFVAYWPEVIAPEQIVDFPGHFVDIMATLVDLTGAAYPRTNPSGDPTVPMEGESLVPIFTGRNVQARQGPLGFEWRDGKALRHGPLKIVKHGDEEWALFDIDLDPGETTDLSVAQPEALGDMEIRYQAWYERISQLSPVVNDDFVTLQRGAPWIFRY